MSKWCDYCYRNEIYNDWNSCSEDCPVFGKSYEELAKDIIVMKNQVKEAVYIMQSMTE